MARLAARLVTMAFGLALAGAGTAFAQSGESPGGAVPKAAKPSATKPTTAKPEAAKKAAGEGAPAVVANYGQWALVCGKPSEGQTTKESCSLIQALVERESQKLVFRIILAYGPQGNLVLRVDGPTGVALQRGLEFTTDEKSAAGKIYRLPFQTCVAQGCRALLVVPEDLKGDLKTGAKGTLRVFTLDGRPMQTVTDLSGFAEGLAALDKRRQAQVH